MKISGVLKVNNFLASWWYEQRLNKSRQPVSKTNDY
jgi:hypothetical protein